MQRSFLRSHRRTPLGDHVRRNAGLGAGLHPRIGLSEVLPEAPSGRRGLVFTPHSDPISSFASSMMMGASVGFGGGSLVGFVPCRRTVDAGSMRDADTYGVLPSEEECAAALATAASKTGAGEEGVGDVEEQRYRVETALLSFMIADAVARRTCFGRWVAAVAPPSQSPHSSHSSSQLPLAGAEEASACTVMTAAEDAALTAVRSALRDVAMADSAEGRQKLTPVPPLRALLEARRYVAASLAFVAGPSAAKEEEGVGEEAEAAEIPAEIVPIADLLSGAIVVSGGGEADGQQKGVRLVHHALSPNVAMGMCSAASLRRLLSTAAPKDTSSSSSSPAGGNSIEDRLAAVETARLDALEAALGAEHDGPTDQAPIDLSGGRKGAGTAKLMRTLPRSGRVAMLARAHFTAPTCRAGVAGWRWGNARNRRRHRIGADGRAAPSGGRGGLLFPSVGGKSLLRHAAPLDSYFVFYTVAEVRPNESLFLSSDVMLLRGGGGEGSGGAEESPSALSLFRAGVRVA